LNSGLLQGFYLDSVLIEPLTGQVTDEHGSRHIPPKAIEVLLYLAQSAGELVKREDLLAKVWGRGKGSQETLGHAISQLRHALDDHVDNPHFIQTLPRRGYRLAVHPVLLADHTNSMVLDTQGDEGLANFNVITNLHRRGVFETALAYLVVGWLLIQVADIVFAQLLLPPWAATFVTVFVISGFPIAIVLSWFLEYRNGRTVVDDLSPIAIRRQRFSRTYFSVLGAFAVASVLVFVYDRNYGLLPVTTEITATVEIEIADNAIAVLPFLNNDGSEETQIFANGLVDDVITRLSRVPGLLVSSRGDAFTLAPNSASSQVRQRLRVSMYLEGSVEIAGDTIRVIVQLIDSANGFHILSRTFDHPRREFFAIRDEITSVTVSSLRAALPEVTQNMTSSLGQDPDLNAYMLYRRGVDESRKPITQSTAASALGWFDAALEIDPEYAAAFAGKCAVLTSAYRINSEADFVRLAESACSTALELNPNLDMVHTALGDLYALTGQYTESEVAYLKALRINPKSVASLMGLADTYRLQRRPEEAEETLQAAIGLQPGNWAPYNSLGYFFYNQGRYEDAAEQFLEVVSLDTKNMRGISNLAASYMIAGRFEEAAPAFQQAIAIEPQSNMYGNLGMMYYYLGRYDEAAAAIRNAIKLTPNDYLVWSNLGDTLFVGGKAGEARAAFGAAEDLIDAALEVNPNDPATLTDLAWIQAMLGNKQQALQTIEKPSSALADDPYVYYIRGLINNRFGNTEEALDDFEAAVAKGYSPTILGAEPHLMNLRNNKKFKDLVKTE